MITTAFTCTGPYAVLIMLGIKRVENRSMMPVPEEGRCAVSCSKSFCKEEYGNFVQWAVHALPPEDFDLIPAWSDVKEWPGKVVGTCEYVARSCGTSDPTEARTRGSAPLPWDEGYPYWWDLSEVVCFDTPIPCRGNVGMWRMPDALAAQVTAADALARCVGEKVATAEDAARIFRAALPVTGDREGFFVLPLDDAGYALSAPVMVSLGHEIGTAEIDLGEVFREALKTWAKSVIVAHNHPSGDLTPSDADLQTTARLAKAAGLIGIRFVDHLVVGGEEGAFVSIFTTIKKKLHAKSKD